MRFRQNQKTLKQNPDVQAFYLGGTGVKDYITVKHYRRRVRCLS
jgi:branched-chain amino acid transport system ATP-binding protein